MLIEPCRVRDSDRIAAESESDSRANRLSEIIDAAFDALGQEMKAAQLIGR